MRYAEQIEKRKSEEMAYRVYVTDMLMAKTGVKTRYWDWIHSKEPKREDTPHTGDEIAFDIIKRADLKPKGQGGER